MIPIRAYQGTRVAVLGLGRTGMATAKALAAGGAEVSPWDDDAAKREGAEAAGLILDDLYARDWGDCGALVISPGIAHTLPKPHPIAAMAKAVGVPIINDITLLGEAFAKDPHAQVIGVTGSNGKSTTCALIAHILSQAGLDVQLGGNIGRAVLDLDPPKPGRVYVLELSSYQLELADNLQCQVAVLTNLSPDHLERHGDMAGYVAAKAHIFTQSGPDDGVILGMDDVMSQTLYTKLRNRRLKPRPVSAKKVLGDGVSVLGGKLYDAALGRSQHVLSLNGHPSLEGRHNGQNVGIAYSVARTLHIRPDVIKAAIASFKGLAHRQERLAPIDRVAFINDSKATNGAAASQALQRFRDIFWILGGEAKSDGVEATLAHLQSVRAAYVYGRDARKLIKQLGQSLPLVQCRSLEDATQRAFDDGLASSYEAPTVLLSPACASFDQFANFEARGAAFKAHVEILRQAYQGASAMERTS
ncbi:UDP-N-acetylmuramoyl-L-alanine--D-glutamate ligase [Woodsholea maritima]|uniref:UDP-N-acetylmuramoyl-L-alanine--D-glutamate ligase n=1 Tax=Woodsholea maritima TaxID=240237 RepID=UPI00035D8896|nr:UDP-N-acetylmuramoyl-L-alanine--D-glutamate ligase [Woodsholea maritima]